MLTAVWRRFGVATQRIPTLRAADQTLQQEAAPFSPQLRAPLILSTIQEMSPRQVAGTLGINEAAVRSRVFRARKILKEKLARNMIGK